MFDRRNEVVARLEDVAEGQQLCRMAVNFAATTSEFTTRTYPSNGETSLGKNTQKRVRPTHLTQNPTVGI